MNIECLSKCITRSVALLLPLIVSLNAAAEDVDAVQLVYRESESGIEPYFSRFTVSERYLRIDDLMDDSGYIVFDSTENRIYSVSNFDRSILVIPDWTGNVETSGPGSHVEYEKLEDAPSVSGHAIYRYREFNHDGADRKKCSELQIAESLLPEVSRMLQKYTRIASAQHIRNLERTPEELRTDCYLIDQVFNDGDYYAKGLPIHEWHSNGKVRILRDYEQTRVDASLFEIPQTYRRYTLEDRNPLSDADAPM